MGGWRDKEDRGVVLETFNSGLDWEVVMDSLSAGLNAIHIDDGYGWAVGDNGLLLKTEYTSTTGMGHDYLLEERDGIHFKNYPNPFHSRTMISYHLPATGDVELSIYDLSGLKVITLVNETQQAGNHEVEWNANGKNPAIYICELKTGQGRRVMKMIKL